MIRLYLWFCRVLFVARGPWVRSAPDLPCALCIFEGGLLPTTRTFRAARTRSRAFCCCHARNLSTSSRASEARPGTHNHRQKFLSRRTQIVYHSESRWLWVPAFAG